MQQDADLAEITVAVLDLAGFRAVHARSLDAARALVAEGDVGLVITDYVVADDDPGSWDRLARFRDDVAPIPVGLLTGWALATDEVARRGFAFYLRKPCPSEQLLAAVSAQLAALDIDEAAERSIRAYFHALETGQLARLAELCTPDVIDHARGVFTALPDPRMEILSITPMPRGALVRYRDRRTDADGAVLFGLRDGAIATVGLRHDLQTL